MCASRVEFIRHLRTKYSFEIFDRVLAREFCEKRKKLYKIIGYFERYYSFRIFFFKSSEIVWKNAKIYITIFIFLRTVIFSNINFVKTGEGRRYFSYFNRSKNIPHRFETSFSFYFHLILVALTSFPFLHFSLPSSFTSPPPFFRFVLTDCFTFLSPATILLLSPRHLLVPVQKLRYKFNWAFPARSWRLYHRHSL